MTNILKYIKDIFKVLIWPIIFIIGQILLVLIFGVIFNFTKYNEIKLTNQNLDEENLTIVFNDYIQTTEYKNELQAFINSNLLYITIITFIVFWIIFCCLYKKYKFDYCNKLNFKVCILLMMFGICLNTCYNFIMSSMNNVINFTNVYNNININIFIYILCTGILGPILEELLFRGIIYNKLKTFNSNMKSIILTSIIFAFFHHTLIQIVYAFCLNFILIYVYEKYKTIKAPILVHISSNVMNFFTCMFIINNNLFLNTFIFLLVILILFIINFKIVKKDL